LGWDCGPSYSYLGADVMKQNDRSITKEWLDYFDWPESEEFYNLMQAYRHAPMEDQKAVVDAYEAVKEYLRGLH
jgi:hypothetical protein